MTKANFIKRARKNVGIESIEQFNLFNAIVEALIALSSKNGSSIKVQASGKKALIDIPAVPVTVNGKTYSAVTVDAVKRTIGKFDSQSSDRAFKEYTERVANFPTA